MRTIDAPLLALCTGSTPARAQPYVEPLRAAMALHAIDTTRRAAPFLANVAVETLYLRAVEEELRYTTVARLVEVFPSLFNPAKGGHHNPAEYVNNPAGLSRLKYQGYHGRGLMHLTWLDAYRAAGLALGRDYVGDPSLVMRPSDAALTACWFWTEYKKINPIADAGNVREVRRLINGNAVLSLAIVEAYTARNLVHLDD